MQKIHPEDAAKALSGIDQNDVGRAFDQEELDLIEKLRPRGPATFFRGDPYDRNRRVKRGDRRQGPDGRRLGPAWKQEAVFTDDSNTQIDVTATNYAIAAGYLRRRNIAGGSFSSFKKLSKAARLLNAAQA